MDLTREIELKIDVMQQGLRVDRAARQGVGTEYAERIFSVFDYYTEATQEMYPGDLIFPLGSVAYVRPESSSPYLIRKEEDTLVLEKDGKFVTTVKWIERPAFYDRLTSDGVEMKKIGFLAGECFVAMCFSNYCMNWEGGNQCLYCNINATQEAHPDHILRSRKVEQFGETAAAVWEEMPDAQIFITTGSLPPDAVKNTHIRILESIQEHCEGIDHPPICVQGPALEKHSDIELFYQAGARAINYNLEVWDSHLFKVICPGKHKNVGRENYLRALEYSVSVFDEGHVWSVFPLGLEIKENYYEAAAYLAERGILIFPQVLIPHMGSKLEGHRAPGPEWMLEVTEKMVDIMAQNMPILLTEEFFQAHSMMCYRCTMCTLVWDIVRKRLGGLKIVRERDQTKKVAA